VFLYYFDALISKMIFKKIKKYIILMYFRVKNTLKNNRNHTSKHTLKKNYTRNLDLFGINPNKFDIMIIVVFLE